jgi:hypothetical protein
LFEYCQIYTTALKGGDEQKIYLVADPLHYKRRYLGENLWGASNGPGAGRVLSEWELDDYLDSL